MTASEGITKNVDAEHFYITGISTIEVHTGGVL